MAVLFSPWGNQQFFDENGDPATGWKIYSYAAGSSTALATYTTSVGNVSQSNPVVLDALGFATGGQIWLTSGLSYKLVLTDANGVVKKTEDNITGVTSGATISQWAASGLAPTYVSGTSFTLAGDQTSAFHSGRRLQFTVTAGTVYGTISSSAYGALTTVTMIMDSGQALDSGLTAVSYGILTATNSSVPASLPSLVSTPFVADVQDFRLTLTSGTPITTTDVTAATTIYAAPFRGKSIALFDGSSLWNVRQSAEFSIALGTITSGRPYDVFCYDNAGVPTLEILAWTNTTTRATALTKQDGIYVKTGATTRRYLGTFYTASTTTTEDSEANRYLFNYYHQADRIQSVVDTTDSWTYTTATWRQARGSAANQFNAVIGIAETLVEIDVHGAFTNAAGAGAVAVGVGVNSTSVNSAKTFGGNQQLSNAGANIDAKYRGYPAVGLNTFAWLEISVAGGTTTFYGDSGTTLMQTGMMGKFKG